MIFLLVSLLLASAPTDQIYNRWLYGKLAAKDLIHFSRLTMPSPSDPLNVQLSRYQVAPHHRYLANALARIVSGESKRLMISVPYRHGKSELAVRRFVPHYLGQFPDKYLLTITHTGTLAWEHGSHIRDCFRSPSYKLCFPKKASQLRDDSQAKDRLQLEGGGSVHFFGRGAIGGGYGADGIIVDDFFKSAEEARSLTVRDSAWRTYTADCKSRLNDSTGWVIFIGTRRNADDPYGRILDPNNIHYDPKEAAQWDVVKLPALAEDDDPLGRPFDAPLWPERFPFEFWDNQRNSPSELIREDFQTQGQCNPIPTTGTYFKKEWLKTYKPAELPRNLRFYGASDHAFKTSEKNDRTCLLSVGICPAGSIWILPDTFWDRCQTDVMVEKMIDLMLSRQTSEWWAASDAISGSIKPFLMRRMKERKCFRLVNDEIRESKDLMQRARSIQGLMAMGQVCWPEHWPMWPQARTELQSFPNGDHDDLVAALAMLGMGLDRMLAAHNPRGSNLPEKGTWAWHTYGQATPQDKTNTQGWT